MPGSSLADSPDDRPDSQRRLTVRLILMFLQVAFLLAVVYFVWRHAGSLLEDFRAADLHGREGWIILSAFLYLVCYGLQAWHCQLVCRTVDPAAPSRTWLSFFASQPYKYLPSSLFTFSFRAKYAHDLGFPFKKSTQAQAIEYANLIASALVLSGVVFLLDRNRSLGIAGLAVLGAAGLAGLIVRSTVRIPRVTELSIPREIVLLALCAAGWTTAGLAFWSSLVALQVEIAVPLAVAVNSLAFAAGILAVFAPGGLGVREALYLANGVAAPAVVLWRLVTVAVDIVAGTAAIAVIALRKK